MYWRWFERGIKIALNMGLGNLDWREKKKYLLLVSSFVNIVHEYVPLKCIVCMNYSFEYYVNFGGEDRMWMWMGLPQ